MVCFITLACGVVATTSVMQADMHLLCFVTHVLCRLNREVDIRLHGTGNSNSHGARPVYYNHLDDTVDTDQQVVN